MSKVHIKDVNELVSLIDEYDKLINKDYKKQYVLAKKIKAKHIKIKKWCEINLEMLEINELIRKRNKK